MSGESEVAQRWDTLNRYLLYFPRSKNVISDVHSFTGKEILSEPYRYTHSLYQSGSKHCH